MAVHRAPSLAEHELLGQYPFLPGAEVLVAELSPSLQDLLEDRVLERPRALGRMRVDAAVRDPTGAVEVEELDQASPPERFLSFVYARLLVSAAPSPAAVRRWAVAEAKRAWRRLDAAPSEELCEVARRMSYELEPEGTQVRIRLTDYLHLATPIREADFHLVRQAVRGGQVLVTQKRAARLVQEGVRVTLTPPIALDAGLRGALERTEGEFLKEIAERVPAPSLDRAGLPGPLRPDLFPPCIRKMQRMLEGGENLSHAGRFALAAFLHRAGAPADGIVDAFRGAPDFDESITRYQVEHITQRDGGRGYEPPECATIRTHGLCFREGDPSAPRAPDRGRDDLCFEPWLRHPVQVPTGSAAEGSWNGSGRKGAVRLPPPRDRRDLPGDHKVDQQNIEGGEDQPIDVEPGPGGARGPWPREGEVELEERGRGEEQEPVRAGQQPPVDPAGAHGLGLGAHVACQQQAHQRGEREVRVRVRGHGQPEEQQHVGVPVQDVIDQVATGGGSVRLPGDVPIDHVEDPPEEDEDRDREEEERRGEPDERLHGRRGGAEPEREEAERVGRPAEERAGDPIQVRLDPGAVPLRDHRARYGAGPKR